MSETTSYGRYGEQSVLTLYAGAHDYPSIIRMQTYNAGGDLLNRYLAVDSDGALRLYTDLPENLTGGQDTVTPGVSDIVGAQTE